MSEQTLRKYINEVIKVTIAGAGGSSKEFEVSDEHEEELEWFIDKYAHAPINVVTKRVSVKDDKQRPVKDDKGKIIKKTEKYYDDNSAKSVSAVVERLAVIGNIPDEEKDAWKKSLTNVIMPWGSQGFDALRYIAVHTSKPGMTPFPFFSWKGQVAVGKTLSYAGIIKSAAVIDHLVNVTPRIGRNDTGKGEFILSLLTEGIAGSAGLYGDVEIGTANWEVKAPSSNGVVRLGIVSSSKFKDLFQDKFYGNKNIQNSYPNLASSNALKMLSSTKNDLENLKATILGLAKEATKETLNVMDVAGIACVDVKSKEIEFVSKDDWGFSFIASERLHVKRIKSSDVTPTSEPESE